MHWAKMGWNYQVDIPILIDSGMSLSKRASAGGGRSTWFKLSLLGAVLSSDEPENLLTINYQI